MEGDISISRSYLHRKSEMKLIFLQYLRQQQSQTSSKTEVSKKLQVTPLMSLFMLSSFIFSS